MKHTITVTLDIPDKHPPLRRHSKHPFDLEMERHGMKDGLLRAKAFFEDHASEFAQLVWTYPDADALELFEHLRESFWTADPATPFPKEEP